MHRQILLSSFFVMAVAGCSSNTELAQDPGGAGGVAGSGTGATGNSGNTGASGGQGSTSGDPGGGGPGGAPAGGAGPGGSGAGPASLPECTTGADCQLQNDCCTCEGIPVDQPIEECLADCRQPMCEALGHIPAPAQCIAGTCVVGFDCTSQVTCAQPEPGCPAGMVASRTAGCWGGCVPTTECAAVTSCDNCDLGSQTCVQYVAQLVSVHCTPQPDVCSGPADCSCASDVFCDDVYSQCTGNGGGIISCECPNC